jgi:hypothetical protein
MRRQPDDAQLLGACRGRIQQQDNAWHNEVERGCVRLEDIRREAAAVGALGNGNKGKLMHDHIALN